MKSLLLVATTAILTTSYSNAQGVFAFSTASAPTRVGSIDGPLAGSGIWGQMLAGATPDALAPVGVPAEHITYLGLPTGLVSGGVITVPGIVVDQTAYVEMLAWDGSRWGTIFSGVPKDQLSMTDVVPVILTGLFGPPPPTPHFTQPAVVPVPEPASLAVGILAAAGTMLRWAVRRRFAFGSRRMTRRRAE